MSRQFLELNQFFSLAGIDQHDDIVKTLHFMIIIEIEFKYRYQVSIVGKGYPGSKLHWVNIVQCLANTYIVGPLLAQQELLSAYY